jgi:hypothetical protein
MNFTAARCIAVLLPFLLTAQTAILQVRIVEGEGAVHPPGSREARGLTVEVTDETGKPVAGAAVSFRIPEEGPGGIFSNGLQTELIVTGADGRATVRGYRLNRNPGPFQIRITVAKEQVRAGIVSNQYITGTDEPDAAARPGQASPRPSAPGPRAAKKKGSGKWVALVLLATAGAAGAAVASTRKSSSPSPTPTPTPTPTTVTIGNPTIVIGRP